MRYLFRLKYLRKLLGKTQEEMGSLFGVSQNTYCNYENGKRRISVAAISKLSQFGVSYEWIHTGTINKNYLDEIKATMVIAAGNVSSASIASRLAVPDQFVQAIIDGEISPSEVFFNRLMTVGFGVDQNCRFSDMVNDAIKKKTSVNVINRIERDDEIERLKTELDAAYEEISRLKNEASKQRGRAEAFLEIIESNKRVSG